MGSFYKYLGFALPLAITVDGAGANPATAPRDSQPVIGFCCLCRRRRTVTYLRWDGQRVCSVDIEDVARVIDKRRSFSRRRTLDQPPAEKLTSEPWDRQAMWDRWFS